MINADSIPNNLDTNSGFLRVEINEYVAHDQTLQVTIPQDFDMDDAIQWMRNSVNNRKKKVFEIDDDFIIENLLKSASYGLPQEKYIQDRVNSRSSVENINQLNETISKKEPQQKVKQKIHDYDLFLKLVKSHSFKCCNGQIFLYDNKLGYFEVLTDDQLKTFIRSQLTPEEDKATNRNKMLEVIDRIKSYPKIQDELDSFDRHSHLINFTNCVFDTKNNFALAHSKEFMFSSCINAKYKQEKSDNTLSKKYLKQHRKGEVFQRFLDDCTDCNLLKKKTLQQLTGYIISEYSNAKKMFFLIGEPHSGKSVWLKIWKNLVGDKHSTAMTLDQLTNNRFMQSRLAYSKLNLSPEMSDTTIKSTDFLKSVTGGDMIAGDRKGAHPFDFIGKTTLIAAGNHMPLFGKLDGTSAFADRLCFTIFNKSTPVEQRDPFLMDKLQSEMDFIVNWALEGLQELVYNQFVFSEAYDSINFKKQYLGEMNNVPEFIKEMCALEIGNKECKVQRKHLYPAYVNSCKENGINALSMREFFVEIEKTGVKKDSFRMYDNKNPLQGYRGIKLKAP